MDVYHNGSIRGNDKQGAKLKALPIHKTFLWDNQEVFIPAVYVGEAGAVLDVCSVIPMEDMIAFFKKWDKKRRLSLKTQEEYEQIMADNPSCQDFFVEISLNGIPLTRHAKSSLNWYPENIFRMEYESPASDWADDQKNDTEAEKLMAAYDCSREYCWHFGRFSYSWNETRILNPQNISLSFQAEPIPATAGYFTTGTFCDCESLKIIHPVTGQEYTLTLYECKQTRQSFADIGSEGIIYPEYCQLLSYGISPKLEHNLFDIRDCTDSDQPRVPDTNGTPSSSCGATAFFMAGKSNVPGRRTAVSSMHFDPVPEVRWRTVFQVKAKTDMEITLPISSLH